MPRSASEDGVVLFINSLDIFEPHDAIITEGTLAQFGAVKLVNAWVCSRPLRSGLGRHFMMFLQVRTQLTQSIVFENSDILEKNIVVGGCCFMYIHSKSEPSPQIEQFDCLQGLNLLQHWNISHFVAACFHIV